jgi:hypothetical protein
MSIHEKLSEKLKTYGTLITLFVATVASVFSFISFIISVNTEPLRITDKRIEAAEIQTQKDLEEHEAEQQKLFDKLATKIQVDDLTTRVDKISQRLDLLLGKLIK